MHVLDTHRWVQISKSLQKQLAHISLIRDFVVDRALRVAAN